MRRPSTPLLDHPGTRSHLAAQENTASAANPAGDLETQCLRHGLEISSAGSAGTAESGAQPCLQPR